MHQMAMAGLSAPLAWPLAPAAPEDAAAPATLEDAAAPAGPGVAAAPAGGGDVPAAARGTQARVTDFTLALAALLGTSVPAVAPASPGTTASPAVPACPGTSVPAAAPGWAGVGVPPGVTPAPLEMGCPSEVRTWPGGPVPPGGPALADPPAAVGLPFPAGLAAAAGLPAPSGLSGGARGPASCGPARAAGLGGVSGAPAGAGEPGCGGAPCGDACEPPFSRAAGLPASARWAPAGGGDLLLSVPGHPVPVGVAGHDGGAFAAGGVLAAAAGGERGADGIRVRITAFAPAAEPSFGPGASSPEGTGPVVRAAVGVSAEAPGAGAAPSARAPGEGTGEQVPAAQSVPAGRDSAAAGAASQGGAGPARAEAAAAGCAGPVKEAGPERRRRVDGPGPHAAPRETPGDAGAGAVTSGAPPTDGAGAAHAGGERLAVAREAGGELSPGLDASKHWPGHRPAEVEVEVDAGDLGQVTVRVAERHGTVAARFLVEGSTVSHLLQRNMPELQARLEQAGLVPGQLEVSLGGSGERGRRGSPSPGQEPLRVGRTGAVSRPSPARGVSARTGAVVARAGAGRGVLDVFM